MKQGASGQDLGRAMSRRGVAAVILMGAIALAGCGGGDDGGDPSSSGSQQRDSVAVVTVPSVLGMDDACKNTLDLLSVSAQMISGQVAPDAARATIQRFLGNVPDEIKDDAAVVVEIYIALIDALEESGGNIATAFSDPEMMAVLERLESADLDRASERISQFISEKCKIADR
jgi:hypothetical protein